MAEEQTRALLELLYHVSREVATALDLRTVLQRVLFQATQNVGGERGTIVVLDDMGKPVDATIVCDEQFHEHTAQQLRDTVERGLAGWVVRNRKPALIADTSRDNRWLRRLDDSNEKTGAKSAICVPLLARERLVGVLTLVHSRPNSFGTEHLELIQAIADQAGIAVLNARLYTESQRQARVMTALAEGAAAINTSLRLDDVLQRILNQTMQALQVETVALALTDPTCGDLVFRAVTGLNADLILERRIPAGKGLTGIVVREGHGLVVPAVNEDSRYKSVDKFGGVKTRALAMAPIQAQGNVIGVLEAINPVSGSFDPDALLVMNGIGGLAGANIQNAQLFERLNAAHQRYRELFETSIDPILITDWKGRVLEANRQVFALSEYPDEQLHGLSIDQLHEVNWNKVGLEFENIMRVDVLSYESLLYKMDGHIVPVQVYVRMVKLDETNVLQWTLRDVSERKALDDLRDDLASMVYHDLRSPMANIISSLGILSSLVDVNDNEEVQSILAIAANSSTRIERLINSLLDINRLESGQHIVNQRAADLAALTRDAQKVIQPAVNSYKQTFTTSIPDSLPPIWADADMALRVLINLLENAVKFTPVGGEISLNVESKEDWLKVSVYNSGPGVPADDQERIFDKFTRLRNKEKSGGLGIGLAFCRLAVEGHGGKIWVENVPGNGSVFSFTLPLATPAQLESEKTE